MQINKRFYSSLNKAYYNLQKDGKTLCLFKENKSGFPVPVSGKIYSKEDGLDVIKRFSITNDEIIVPTTTVYRKQKSPIAFIIHKTSGQDIYGALMGGRVVSAVEDDALTLRRAGEWKPSPMAKRFINKICEYLKV